MGTWLTGGGHSIMATRAIGGRCVVVERGGCPRGRRFMAGVTLCRGGNVGCWFHLSILSQERTGVASTAITRRYRSGSGRMIHHARRPSGISAGMTRIALRGGWYMHSRFGQGIGKVKRTVVARTALPCGTNVVHLRWLKRCYIRMASIALHSGRNVIDRLTNRRHIVVAIRAAPINRRRNGSMIRFSCCRPSGGRFMAAIALRSGGNVSWWFSLCVLRQHRTVVADRAISGRNWSHHIGVHHAHTDRDWRKRHARGMTRVA